MTRAKLGAFVWASRFLLSLGLLLSIAIIYRNTLVLVGTSVRAPLGFSSRIWPTDGTLELIDQRLIVPQIDWSDRSPTEVIRAARRAHSLDPLDEWPFALAGMVAIKSANYEKSTVLLAQAHRRNARAITPHMLLILSYAQRGLIDQTMKEMVSFINLRPQYSAPLVPNLLATLSQGNSEEIMRKVDRYPKVLAILIEGASQSPGSETSLPMLLARPGVTRAMKIKAIQSLALMGRGDLAYPMWQRLAKASWSIPYDSNFQGLEGPQPYVWSISTDSNFNAEFSKRADDDRIALDVEAFGTVMSHVVDQTFQLPIGKHSLRISGTAIDPQDDAGRMRWIFTCAGQSRALTQTEFPMIKGLQRREMRFSIPETGCDFQTLSLQIIPGESRAGRRMRFNSVKLDMEVR